MKKKDYYLVLIVNNIFLQNPIFIGSLADCIVHRLSNQYLIRWQIKNGCLCRENNAVQQHKLYFKYICI